MTWWYQISNIKLIKEHSFLKLSVSNPLFLSAGPGTTFSVSWIYFIYFRLDEQLIIWTKKDPNTQSRGVTAQCLIWLKKNKKKTPSLIAYTHNLSDWGWVVISLSCLQSDKLLHTDKHVTSSAAQKITCLQFCFKKLVGLTQTTPSLLEFKTVFQLNC